MTDAWVRSNRLYELAKKRVKEKEGVLFGTDYYWYETMKEYEKLGGQLASDDTPGQPN